MAKDAQFIEAKEDVTENLEAIQLSLVQCVDEGMIDSEDAYYNQLVDLLDEARNASTWDALMEIVSRAQTLEIDVAGWLSFHGRTTVSLPWPTKPFT